MSCKRVMSIKVLVPVALLVLMVIEYSSAQVTVSPQYCPRTFTRRTYENRDVCRWVLTCYGWQMKCYRQCFYRIETYVVYNKYCCDGYKGTRCNIPICIPACQNGGLCIAKNKCDCPSGSTGGTCQFETCSYLTDCYPGICETSTGSPYCQCASGFEGNNCLNMKIGPEFPSCSGHILNKNQTLESAKCTPGDENSTVVINSHMRDFDKIQFKWLQTYPKVENLPQYPPAGFLRNFTIGVIDVEAEIRLRGTDGVQVWNKTAKCSTAPSPSTPQEAVPCEVDIPFTRGIAHNQEMDLIMRGETGGFKQVRDDNRPGEYLPPYYFSGQNDFRKVTWKFDLVKPYHCSEIEGDGRCEIVDDYPVVAIQDITTDPRVQFLFLGWNDSDSDLFAYRYNIYPMSLNGEGKLQEDSNPIISGNYTIAVDDQNANITLPQTGLYSIVGEVLDVAGNIRIARALVLYGSEEHTVKVMNKSMEVTPRSNLIDRTHWLTDLSANISIHWTGLFVNEFVNNGNYLAEVEPLRVDGQDDAIDYDHGNLSTAGTPNRMGISRFQYFVESRVQLPSSRKKHQISEPTTWISIEPISDSITLPFQRVNGAGFTFWIRAEDPFGNVRTDFNYIRIDNTPPLVSDLEFRKNVERPERGYFSSFNAVIIDVEGGVSHVEYALYDVKCVPPCLISEGVQTAQLTDQDQSVCLGTGSCTCTNIGECYTRPQQILINNCVFLNFTTVERIRFNATFFNRALLGTTQNLEGIRTNLWSGTQQNLAVNDEDRAIDTTLIGAIADLDGIDEYPPPYGFRLKRAFGFSVLVTWYPSVACYDVRSYNIEIMPGNVPQPILGPQAIEAEIPDLAPNTNYDAMLYVVYDNRRESEKVTLSFFTGEPPDGIPPDKLSAGAIAGIVIGILLFLGLVAIAIAIIIRVRRKQPPLPRRLETMRKTIHDRFSTRFGHGERQWDNEAPPPYRAPSRKGVVMNVAYAKKGKILQLDEDDIYAYGEMVTDPNAQWKHSNDKMVLGKTISTGRFAEIRVGHLTEDGHNKRVAVKMLKNQSEEDELLMKAKMNFMATAVPHHNNIVNFAGAITEGPMILLEYCDHSLKDWLKAIKIITDETEDNMTNFCTDIARGMEHLHDNEIIHRRLGVRNVLLRNVPMMGRLVAKVTGFGPMKGEQSAEGVDSDKERIPIKWMAIEQLGLGKKQRPYDKKTDVWSFGVVVWEIFSRGATPWSQQKHADIRNLLESGQRLECPADCSEELYTDVMMACWLKSPSKRPNFKALRGTLEKLFHGAPDGDEYYGTEEDINMDDDGDGYKLQKQISFNPPTYDVTLASGYEH